MKRIVLGITGSIAAFKAAELASKLVKAGVEVNCIMTQSACQFIAPLTFETLTCRKVSVGLFDVKGSYKVEHISLAKRGDVLVIAPASANIIAKLAHGICDDMLSTVAMASTAPLLIAPAMNTQMYNSPANLENMRILQQRGAHFVSPECGRLACGDVGNGKLANVQSIVDAIVALLYPVQDFQGKHLLITAGPTVEPIDPVRYISNRSSGKMGYALAQAAIERGGQVTLVTGKVNIPPPAQAKVVQVQTTQDMFCACMEHLHGADVIIKAAAPADFTVANVQHQKMKKTEQAPTLELIPTVDIISAIGANKEHRFVCGFAAETQNLEKYATDKLKRKHLDMIVANDVSRKDIGFDSDDNAVNLYFADGTARALPLASKQRIAHGILDEIAKRL